MPLCDRFPDLHLSFVVMVEDLFDLPFEIEKSLLMSGEDLGHGEILKLMEGIDVISQRIIAGLDVIAYVWAYGWKDMIPGKQKLVIRFI